MPVTPGHFQLSPEQRHFKKMLEHCPWLKPYWDFEHRSCDLEALKNAIPAMSHGEQIMARFLAAVWLGENQLDFDMIDAATTLDDSHRKIIIDWLTQPVFP